MATKPIPDGYRTVTPMLMVDDAEKLIHFITHAFGGIEKNRFNADGKVMHAEITIGDSLVMLGQANEKWPVTKGALYLYVKDVDSVYKQAVKAGGKSLREPVTEFYGDRSAGVQDSFGNQWWIATHVEDISPKELEKRQREMSGQSRRNS